MDISVTISNECRSDLDSYADQCAVGSNALIVHDCDRPVNVTGYNPDGPVDKKDMRTVTGALAYDDPVTGEPVILLVHQAIYSEYLPNISHNLLSMMQVQLNDVIVNDCPRFLTDHLTDLTHLIAIPLDGSDQPYVIPLSLNGVTSSFPTRKPTIAEYESLPHFSLTIDKPTYDPFDASFAQQEEALLNYMSQTGDRIGAPPPSCCLCTVSNMFSTDVLDGPTLSLQQTIPTFDVCSFSCKLSVTLAGIQPSIPGKQFEAHTLARNWGIDLQTAK